MNDKVEIADDGLDGKIPNFLVRANETPEQAVKRNETWDVAINAERIKREEKRRQQLEEAKKYNVTLEATALKPKRKSRDEMIIRTCQEGNPKAQGTQAYIKYSFVRDGMTVGEYKEAAKEYKDGKWVSSMIAHCLEKGFFKFVPPGE